MDPARASPCRPCAHAADSHHTAALRTHHSAAMPAAEAPAAMSAAAAPTAAMGIRDIGQAQHGDQAPLPELW